MSAALGALPGSFAVTHATGDGDFAARIRDGDYDLAILAVQSEAGYSSIAALGHYVRGGGRAIYQSWTGIDAELEGFAATFSGRTNDGTVNVSDAGLSAGLGTVSLVLTNPGWETFSTGLAGASVAARFSNGDAAILIGNNGRTIVNGFLTDTIANRADAVQLYTNEIYAVTGTSRSVPDATSSLALVLFGAGAMLVLRRRLA